MLRTVARSSAARYVRTAVQTIRNETDFRSQLKQNESCVVGFFEDGPESSRVAKSDLNTVSAEFANVPFLEISGTRFPQLLRDHEIERIPAVVTFRDGKVVDCRVNPDKNAIRSIIKDLPDAEQSSGIFSMFFGKNERQQQKELEQRVEEAHDKVARKEWETSPEEAVHKKHPLRKPDTDADTGAGLNTLATGLKEGYDEAMDEVQHRARQQRKQAGKQAVSKDNVLILNKDTDSTENRESNNRSRKHESKRSESNQTRSNSNNRSDVNDSTQQQSFGSGRNSRDQDLQAQKGNQEIRDTVRRDHKADNKLNRQMNNDIPQSNNNTSQTETPQASKQNKNIRDTTRSDHKIDSKLNKQMKSNQRDADDDSHEEGNRNESRHGELETAKRSTKSSSGNIDMNQTDTTKRSSTKASSNDQRPTSAERKTAQKAQNVQ